MPCAPSGAVTETTVFLLILSKFYPMLLEPSGFLAVFGAGTPNLVLDSDKQSLLSFAVPWIQI